MSSTVRHGLASHSCSSCKHGKRKCDKLKPSCSACTRIGRTCIYEGASIAGSSTQHGTGARPSQAPTGARLEPPSHPVNILPGLATDITLQKPDVDLRVRAEALKILGSVDSIYTMAGIYFNSIDVRMSILSKRRFLERTVGFATSAPADFAALCLAMNLIIQLPESHSNVMQSPLYAHLKGIIGLLEAANYQSLEVVQCRVICAFYELGHGIHPAVSVSLGACSRVARFVGLDAQANPSPQPAENSLAGEESRRVWWMLVNLDRFVSLTFGDHVLCCQDARADELLPIDDKLWLQDIIPPRATSDATLSVSYDNRVGQLARECQVSHLAGRVVRHVFDPTSDSTFQEQEAARLEQTLTALMPILCADELKFGRYCSSMGICSSALYLLYDYPTHARRDELTIQNALSAMEPLSTQIVDFSHILFGESGEGRDYSTFSPYVPLSLYQSAVVQLRLWKQTGDSKYEDGLNSLKRILRLFNRRWVVSGQFLEALKQDSPVLLPHSISAR